jgi:hypothetical protein
MKRILLLGLVIGAAVWWQNRTSDSPFGDDHEANVEFLRWLAEEANRELPTRAGEGLTVFRVEATDAGLVHHYRIDEGFLMLDMEQASRAELQRSCGSRSHKQVLAAGFSIRILYSDHRGSSVGTLTLPPGSCLGR